MIDPSARIHRLALVDNSHVGARSRIWQFASLIRGARVGTDCNVASAAILDGAQLGDHCIVGHGCSLNPGFRAGDEVFIGPNVTSCNDCRPCVSKENFDVEMILSGLVIVFVSSRASIGAGAVILPGVTIGEDAMIAAGATVERNVPPGHLLRRDGRLVPIEPAWRKKRMRAA